MKILIASDIHGSAFCCRKLMEAVNKETPEKLLLLGDVLYHGPRNALPEEYNPQAVSAMLNELNKTIKILCVRGNCDSEVDQMMLEFPIMAEYCLLFVRGRTIFATHGHIYNGKNMPPISSGDILLHGHTHVAAWENLINDCFYLNPGSVSIPKNDSKRGYMTLDNNGFVWKDLDGNIFHNLKFNKRETREIKECH